MEEGLDKLHARGGEGSRRKRRERYLSVIMDILRDGEWHSLQDLAYEAKLTTSEVTGLLARARKRGIS